MLYLHQKRRKHRARVPNASGTRSISNDYAGRRFEKKVTTKGDITTHHRYLYRGYLQIAAVNLKANASTPDLPSTPGGYAVTGWYTYGWDLTKNICEIYGQQGYIRTIYRYSPYGTVTAVGDVQQAIQWSSEMCDGELGLIYYNYRYYNSQDGSWLSREPIGIGGGINLYGYLQNAITRWIDFLGLHKFDPTWGHNDKVFLGLVS